MLTVEVTDNERRMVMRALANMLQSVQAYPLEYIFMGEINWAKLLSKFGTAEAFTPRLCKHKTICPHAFKK